MAVLLLLVFMPALDADFVRWDDDLVRGQRHHFNLTSANLAWMFTTTFAGHYQPLTWLSYAIDYKFFSLDPFGYHLTNFVWHLLTVFSFYFLVRRLLAVGTRYHFAPDSAQVLAAAALAACVFGIHPLRVESVAWIAERRDVLSGFFYVAAVACYVRYAATVSGAVGIHEDVRSHTLARCYYVASVMLCLVSLLAKASAMTIPLVLLILDVFPLRRLKRGANGRRGRNRLIWLDKIPFVVLAVAAGVVAWYAQATGGAMHSFAEHDFSSRMAQASYGLVFYLWKTVWPTGLGPLYEIPHRTILMGAMFWTSLVVVAAVVVFAIRAAHKRPAIPAALGAYFVIVAPVLGFAQNGPQLVADRYSYLPCLGLAALAGAALLAALRSDSWWQHGHRRSGLMLIVGVVVAWLAHQTMNQSEHWLSPLHLWARGVAISPDSPIANINYADALAVLDMPSAVDAAERFYKKGLSINPKDTVGLHHYADLLRRTGRKQKAITLYLQALAIDPTRDRACFSLGRSFVDVGQPALALPVLRDGAKRNPKAYDLIDYLARMLASHPDDSIRNGAEALQLAKQLVTDRGDDHIGSMITLSSALAEVGQFDQAIAISERALALAESSQSDQLTLRLQDRLALFREGQAFHAGP